MFETALHSLFNKKEQCLKLERRKGKEGWEDEESLHSAACSYELLLLVSQVTFMELALAGRNRWTLTSTYIK
jgi:hypothetical protein